jgi:hypothetical protein
MLCLAICDKLMSQITTKPRIAPDTLEILNGCGAFFVTEALDYITEGTG